MTNKNNIKRAERGLRLFEKMAERTGLAKKWGYSREMKPVDYRQKMVLITPDNPTGRQPSRKNRRRK